MSKGLGKLGERVAEKFFEQRGWVCVGRNVFFREGELDLVFQQNNRLLFVEVKTRASGDWDQDFPRMSFQKIKRYKISAIRYLRAHSCRGFEMLVVYVTLDVLRRRAQLRCLNLKDFYT